MRDLEIVLLRVPEVAERLGVKQSTVRAWLLRRQLVTFMSGNEPSGYPFRRSREL
jgi:excisionase family DNA binding protein